MANKVYIAGKVTGTDYQKCKAKFKRYEEMLIGDKHEVVNPTRYISEETNWDDAMTISMLLLRDCNTIFLINDWKNSKGAKQELMYALKNNYKIMTYYDITID